MLQDKSIAKEAGLKKMGWMGSKSYIDTKLKVRARVRVYGVCVCVCGKL